MSNTKSEAASIAPFNGRAMVDRLRELYDAPNDTDLALKLGKPRATVAAWSGRNVIPLNVLIEICSEKSSSLDWIVFGVEHSECDKKLPFDKELLTKVVDLELSSKVAREVMMKGNPNHIAETYIQCANAIYGSSPTMSRSELIDMLEASTAKLKALPHNQ